MLCQEENGMHALALAPSGLVGWLPVAATALCIMSIAPIPRLHAHTKLLHPLPATVAPSGRRTTSWPLLRDHRLVFAVQQHKRRLVYIRIVEM